MATVSRTTTDSRVSAAAYARLVADGTRLLTTNYVVDETATRLRCDSGLTAALAFRTALDRSTAGGSLRIAWIDPKLEREGWDLFERHADVSLSLTDAVSAAVARRVKVRQVFGFDTDFRAMGFDVQPVA